MTEIVSPRRSVDSILIFGNVPDLYLRNFGKEVVEKLVAYPQTSRAAQVLAKTGSERALALIPSNRAISAIRQPMNGTGPRCDPSGSMRSRD